MVRAERDFLGILIPEGGGCHEAQTVFGQADHLCPAADGERHDGGGGLPQTEVSEATFYRWKEQFAGMGVAGIRRLKQLENRKVKRLVADLSLDTTMLRVVLRRKF